MSNKNINSKSFNLEEVLNTFKLSENDLVEIQRRFSYEEIKKGKVFNKRGRICSKVGILLNGLLVAKFNTKDDKLNVSRFFYHPNHIIVTSYNSFNEEVPSEETIEVLEDSVLLCLSKSDLNELYEIAPATNKIGRHFAEYSYNQATQRIYDLQVLNANDRIEKFYSKNSGLFNRVSKQMIASYLRVNRNVLGRVVSKINGK